MAQQKEERQVTQTVVVGTTCDLCNSQQGKSDRWPPDAPHGEDEVTISHRKGLNYPDGGQGDDLQVDCCPTCWNERVLPALRSLGLARQYAQWDW